MSLHPNHLPDLRYVLRVLQGLHVQQHQKNEVAAAINGMTYIIKRTEESLILEREGGGANSHSVHLEVPSLTTENLSESPDLAQVLDALRIGRVACEWAGHPQDAEKIAQAMDAARSIVNGCRNG